MATSTIRSCGVATESTFGSVATSDGYPDASGLTFAGLECRRGSLTTPGEQPNVPREDARASAYSFPAEVPGVYSGGNPRRLREGTVTLTVPMRTIGAATTYANYAAMPLGRLLGSGCGVDVPGASFDAVTLTGDDVSYVSTDASLVTLGGLLKVDRDASDRVSFTGVTDTDPGGTDLINHSPALEAAVVAADSIRQCNVYHSALGTSTLGASVALRLNGDGWRSYLVGGRWQSVRLYLEGNLVMADIVIQGMIYDDHDNASVTDYTRADGAVANNRGCFHIISSSAIGTTTPAGLARTVLNLDAWEITVTNTLAMVGRSDDAMGHSDLEVVDQVVEGSITVTTPQSAFDDFLLDQEQRSLMFGFGPLGNGNGMCVYVPAGTFTSDPSVRNLDGERVTQVLNFTQGNWTLDDSTTAPADTNWRIGLAL